jgi:hypothetical protein
VFSIHAGQDQLMGEEEGAPPPAPLAVATFIAREILLTRRARTALGTATQCTRRNDWLGHPSHHASA